MAGVPFAALRPPRPRARRPCALGDPLARRAGALATSGLERRHWMQGDQSRHHLIDPATGDPSASGLWSVTAVAGACAQAEVAAKTALILGAKRGARFIETARLGALLVERSGAWSAVGAWPSAGMRPLAADTTGATGATSEPEVIE
ncbi:MAG TPA: FAD:protein FMN transferase [Ktedonobacterales bacterium]|nr:FAD:protein FMN transferase [Ktedonobacterales bacterium]